MHLTNRSSYSGDNHLPLMNKALSKEITKNPRLRNKFLRKRTEQNVYEREKPSRIFA